MARRILTAFLFAFLAARIIVFLIVTRRIPDIYAHLGGTHIHHLNYGIFLLSGVDVQLQLVWVDIVLHKIFPFIVVLDWIVDPPTTRLTSRDTLLWLAYPLVWMVTMAFKPYPEWTTAGTELTWWPRNPTWQNIEFLLQGHAKGLVVSLDKTIGQPFLASLVTSILGTAVAVVCGTLASYAVVRYGVGQSLPMSVLQLRLFPPLAVMIPVMVMWAFFGAIDTWWGLSLIYGIVTLPFAFWLMKTFFDEVPVEIEEAARVDGCSHWRVFWRITLPIVKPGLATCALFVFKSPKVLM